MNKDTLLNALNDYLLHIQLDPIGDITSKINAVEACRNYVAAIDGDVENQTALLYCQQLTISVKP